MAAGARRALALALVNGHATAHTERVRARLGTWLLAGLVAWLGAAAPAASEPANRGNFWERLIEPHAHEVAVALQQAEQRLHEATGRAGNGGTGGDSSYNDVSDSSARQAMLDEAYEMLCHAQLLAPRNLEVTRLLAQVAGVSGRTEVAISNLAAYLAAVERPQPADHLLMGRLLARARRTDEAIRSLRLALGDGLRDEVSASATLFLASLLTTTGRLPEAIQLLEAASDRRLSPQAYGGSAAALLPVALAVAYDKDEQLTRAHQVLDAQLARIRQPLADYVLDYLRGLDYAPLADRHYYYALVYEVSDHLPEARAAWLAYIASGPSATYHARARQHVEAIDQLLHERLLHERSMNKASRIGGASLAPTVP